MKFARARRATLGCAVALTVAVSGAACGSDSKKPANGLEKSDITVGIMPVVDDAPLMIGISKGLFKAEGLNVKTQIIAGGADAIPKLKSGNLDFSFGNYVSFFGAQAQGALDMKIVSEEYNLKHNSIAVVVPKDSPIKTPKDLAGKKIATNTKKNVSTLLVRAGVKPYGVDLDEDKNFVEAPFPNHEALLKGHKVDASLNVEPFVTQMEQSMGARVLIDCSTGTTAEFPVAGFAASASFTKKNPKTVAAFQRAMDKAKAMAADRKTLQAIVPTYTKIDAKTASALNYGTYPTSLNATRLQRVADVMQQFGYLQKKLDVAPLIATNAS